MAKFKKIDNKTIDDLRRDNLRRAEILRTLIETETDSIKSLELMERRIEALRQADVQGHVASVVNRLFSRGYRAGRC